MAGYVDFAALTPHLRLRLVHGGACRCEGCSMNFPEPRFRARDLQPPADSCFSSFPFGSISSGTRTMKRNETVTRNMRLEI